MMDDGRQTTDDGRQTTDDGRWRWRIGSLVTRHSSLVIVDYGVGNLRSVYKAVEAAGATAEVITSPDGLAGAAGIVLPGVGAFGDAAANLRAAGFEAPLRQAVQAGTPLLGICVGMQLLFDESEEMGRHAGLGIIPGRVVRFAGDLHGPDGRLLKVPQIGWNQLCHAADRPAAGRRAGWRLRLFRAFVLLRPGRSRPRGGDDRLRRPVCLGGPARTTSGASSATRRRARRWGCGFCGTLWRSWAVRRENG